jgi:hypothetical protein
MLQYKQGTITAAGTAAEVNLGFIPSLVKVFNPLNGITLKWLYSMGTTIAGVKEGNIPYLNDRVVKATRSKIGSTATQVYNSAFDFALDGVVYTKAATAAGSALTATTVPTTTWGLFGWEVVANGTISSLDAADNATGYATEALAIAAMPSQTANKIFFMYITVSRTGSGGFIGATTELSDEDTIVHYYNVLPWNMIASGGISVLDDGTSMGFTLGTDSEINVSGETLYYEAIGVH